MSNNVKQVAFIAGYSSKAQIEKTASRKIAPGQQSLLKALYPRGNVEGNAEAATGISGHEGRSSIVIDNANLITGRDKG